MHPKLHRSEAWSYDFSTSEISGALYHLEPTCSDIRRFISFLLGLSLTRISPIITYFWGNCCQIELVYKLCDLFCSNLSVALILTFKEFRLFPKSSGNLLVSHSVGKLHFMGKLLESPKSHSFTLQSEEIRIFAGFTSL